ncbi:MAG: FAD-binding oxidoreductase [Nevskia sp.]|nr:FAD-binding oxidoreductase [Nevskia sp.]
MSGADWVQALAGAVGGVALFDDPIDLLSYQRDCSVVPPGGAALAARPANAEEVAALVAAAARARQPVYVRGGGTMYAGGANPHAGGLVIDMAGMARVLELDLARGIVVVEPGIRFAELLEVLAPHGQTVGIVPLTGPAATVGGAVAAHALGTGSARHQSMGDCVAGLEAVLADGTRLRTGSAACHGAGFFQRYCIGPDLTGLFLGSDATFGVVTAVCLWLYPAPAARASFCLGLPDAAAAGRFLAAVQGCELTRNVWYAAGYEGAAVRARVTAAQPARTVAAWPGFCVAFDLGGAPGEIDADRARLAALAGEEGGDEFAAFDEAYFRKLRYDETYWYSFAGYFGRSRCAILMSSLPCDRLAVFCAAVEEQRKRWPAFVWGAASVVCRRGLHGGVLAFYDERHEWETMRQAIAGAADALVAAGCVPYKSGKLWAPQVRACTEYFQVLEAIKRGLDPQGLLSPGNLGLGA